MTQEFKNYMFLFFAAATMYLCYYLGSNSGYKEGWRAGRADVYWEAVYWKAGQWEVPSFDINGRPEKYFTFNGREKEFYHGKDENEQK